MRRDNRFGPARSTPYPVNKEGLIMSVNKLLKAIEESDLQALVDNNVPEGKTLNIRNHCIAIILQRKKNF